MRLNPLTAVRNFEKSAIRCSSHFPIFSQYITKSAGQQPKMSPPAPTPEQESAAMLKEIRDLLAEIKEQKK